MTFSSLRKTLAVLLISLWCCAFKIPPPPQTFILDAADLLSQQEESTLNRELVTINSSKAAQIVVATFPSLEGENLEDLSIKIAESWKPGHNTLDNGILLLIFKEDRSLRIEVGYGLESQLTDAESQRIIRTIIVPWFKKKEFAIGVFSGIHAIAEVVIPNYQGPSSKIAEEPRELPKWFQNILLLVMGGLIFIGMRYGRYSYGLGRGGSYRSFGGFGSGFGGGFGGGSFGGGSGSFGGGGSSGSW